MAEVAATEASRHLARLLDAVEHRGDSYTIVRHGRAVARLMPLDEPRGRAVKALLRARPDDPTWAAELRALRDGLADEERRWPG